MYDLGPDTPLTYVNTPREERFEGPLRLTVPDSQFQALLPENIGWHEAPDPIRQSDFWDAGDKILPAAHMRITSRLRIPTIETIMEDQFHIGKLIGYLKVPMYQGGQLPSVIRANIQPAVPTTYGSLYEVSPIPQTPGPAFSASGFEEGSSDGYPY